MIIVIAVCIAGVLGLDTRMCYHYGFANIIVTIAEAARVLGLGWVNRMLWDV